MVQGDARRAAARTQHRPGRTRVRLVRRPRMSPRTVCVPSDTRGSAASNAIRQSPARHAPVCDNVHSYGGRHPRRLRASARSAKAMDLSLRDLARALRRLRADALPGRARRDEPDADRRRPHRRRARPPALPAAAPRRGRHGHASCAATSAAAAAPTATAGRSSRRRCPASAPRSPATRSSPAPAPAARATRRCTSPARARPASSSAGTLTFVCDGARHELADRRLRDLRRRPSAPLREPRRGGSRPARRRVGRAAPLMSQTLFDRIWAQHEVSPTGCSTSTCTSSTRSRARRPSTACGSPAARSAAPTARSPPPTTTSPPTARRSPPASATSSRACRSRRSSATARSSGSRSTRWAPTARASCT